MSNARVVEDGIRRVLGKDGAAAEHNRQRQRDGDEEPEPDGACPHPISVPRESTRRRAETPRGLPHRLWAGSHARAVARRIS